MVKLIVKKKKKKAANPASLRTIPACGVRGQWVHVAGLGCAPGFARRGTWRRRGAPPKGKEKGAPGSAAPWSLSEERASEPRAREKRRLGAFLLVLNLKPQKCAVLRGRVASCSDSRGDPSPPIPAKSRAPFRHPLLLVSSFFKSKTEYSLSFSLFGWD